MRVHLDFETASELDIKVGASAYAEHPSTRILCVSWAIGDEVPSTWAVGEPLPAELIALASKPDVPFYAWNCLFEHAVWQHHMVPLGFPPISIDRWRNTQAKAMLLGLPAALDGAAKALELAEQKDDIGKKLMLSMSKGHAGSLHRLREYCAQDVRTERAVHAKVGDITGREFAVYQMDKRINVRGVPIDLELARYAAKAADDYQAVKAAEMQRRFKLNPTQVAAIGDKLRSIGVFLEDLTADTIDGILDTPAAGFYPQAAVEMLKLRREAAAVSPKKFAAMLRAVSTDGRIRGMFSYCGALQTGRWSGRVVQLHNLKRPDLGRDAIRLAMAALKVSGGAWGSLLEFGPVLSVLGDLVRPTIMPANGVTKSDASQIEARVLAWLADEWEVLETFRRGEDVYCTAASGIYGRTITPADEAERQIGKVACFAAGTQVLTRSGPKAIETIETTDQLWDGEEWTTHQGLVAQGTAPTIELAGVRLTPDHLVLTGETWKAAQRLATHDATLCRALVTASVSLPWWAMSTAMLAVFHGYESRARAGLSPTKCGITTCAKAFQHAATRAPNCKPRTGAKTTGPMLTSCPTTRTVAGCLTASARAFSAARIRAAQSGRTTVRAAFTCMKRGATRALVAARSSRIWSRLLGGMIPRLSLTASATGATTNREICGSSPSASTSKIAKPSAHSGTASSNLKPVFDILNVGPRHRFTILTQRGPLIVHNCLALGYGGGKGAFMTMGYNYGLIVAEERAEEIKVAWREANPAIVKLWADVDEAMHACIGSPGITRDVGRLSFVMHDGTLWCRLPSGRSLAWHGAKRVMRAPPWELDKPEEERKLRAVVQYRRPEGPNMVFDYTRGAVAVENICQAVSRDLLAEAMVFGHRLPLFLHVHDELGAEDDCVQDLHECMLRPVGWADGLPRAAKTDYTDRYFK